jgi:DNA-binding Lrp family transcriptional regulator
VRTSQLDEVDRQFLHALMVAPRASLRQLAAVLGVSDQTVARRYRRLAETAGLRVYGLVNGQRAGWVDWLVRLRVTPGSAQRMADTLASRPDTRWVRIYSGGTEIVTSLQARTPEQRNTLFLQGLPGSRHVTAITAQSILNVFTPVAYVGYASALSAAQLSALQDGSPRPTGEATRATGEATRPTGEATRATGEATRATGEEERGGWPEVRPAPGTADLWAPAGATLLRAEDDALLAELYRDGRASVANLAAATHWHESTVRRRIDELREAGLLYFDVDVDDSLLGVRASVMLWLKVEPASLDAAGRAVAAHPEIPFAAATTGTTNLAVSAVFRDTRQLYVYLTTRLAELPGLQSVEVAPIIATLKRVGTWEATVQG